MLFSLVIERFVGDEGDLELFIFGLGHLGLGEPVGLCCQLLDEPGFGFQGLGAVDGPDIINAVD